MRSLRVHLLWLLLPPITALLAIGAIVAYYPSMEPASAAYDRKLMDVAFALGSYVEVTPTEYRFELPAGVEEVLRADSLDTIYYRVISPGGLEIAGERNLPGPESDSQVYNAILRDEQVRVVSVQTPCGPSVCTVLVGETTNKRHLLARSVIVSSLFPELLIALATLVIVWFGVKRGLWPLARLSEEIKARSPRDLRPIDARAAPEETRPLVAALNGLLEEVAQAAQQQQRFLANAAHQLRTPLAGLQAHTELALAQPMPAPCRAHLEQVHQATIRTARLANQLLALARAERGGRGTDAAFNLRTVVEGEADAWVRQALERNIDLGFELAPAPVEGDAMLLREALANLVHNAVQYSHPGGRVTVRTGQRDGRAFAEVEDDGPGIPPPERRRVLQRFYRVPGTPGTGSGLGLAIVREIAAGHGARVEISDGAAGDRGCRVALTFPHG
ncbi:MAG TPA: sensor histidine kinase N-terminal domain-containing protein [Burkholderiales bacterium]|nr:sensor histidine kinase N-terminal domain-containing protein [Burkholderiales bacterium]